MSVESFVRQSPQVAPAVEAPPPSLDVMTSPLALDGWLEFNRVKWGVEPVRVRLTAPDAELPAVHAVYYLNQKGQIWRPRTSVYIPMTFEATPTQSRARLDRQWLAVGELVAEDMAQRGLAAPVILPPEIQDARPWQWAGFWVTMRYTFYLDLPHPESMLDPAVRRQIAKCVRAGFSYERVSDLTDVMSCIAETERRQGFSYGISKLDLELARSLVGEDSLRAYVCYTPEGEPASARIVLHRPGGRAIDWLVGSVDAHLRTGATQYLLSKVLEDLDASGAAGFDFEGANLPSVAASKSIWGGQLVSFFVVEKPSVRGIARRGRDYWRTRLASTREVRS